jgi:RP/EB family microtubule-associated protein
MQSRGELLAWINGLLALNLTKLEQLGTGAVYCQLYDIASRGKVNLAKVNWKAKQEYEYVNNFKILQQAFLKDNVQKPIDV